LSADAFIMANSMIDEVYFWEHLTAPGTGIPGAGNMNFSMQDISMYNLMGGTAAAADITGIVTEPNGVISTAQGFGIKATAAGTAIFNNSMRLTSGNNTLRAPLEKDRVWLQIKSAKHGLVSNALIGFSQNTTEAFDSGYDSRRLASVLSLYSHIESDGTQELGIQSLAPLEEDSKVFLGFSSLVAEETDYSISILNREGPSMEQVKVFLYDNELNVLTEITDNEYVFTSGKGTFHNRFTLLFEGDVLGNNNFVTLSNIKVYPNPTKGTLEILSVSNSLVEKAELLDLQGRVLQSFNINNRVGTIDISNFASATYLLKLTSEKGETIKRIIKE